MLQGTNRHKRLLGTLTADPFLSGRHPYNQFRVSAGKKATPQNEVQTLVQNIVNEITQRETQTFALPRYGEANKSVQIARCLDEVLSTQSLDETQRNQIIEELGKVGGSLLARAAFDWLVQQYGYPFTLESYNEIISVCRRCHDLPNAFKMFEVLQDQGLQPDIFTYNLLLDCCKVNQELDRAMQLLFQMERTGISPNSFTFVTLVSACNERGRGMWDQALLVFHHMLKSGIAPTADPVVTSELITVCEVAMSRASIQESLKIYHGLRQAGVSNSLRVYTGILRSCAQNLAREGHRHALDTALQAWTWMGEGGVSPDTACFNFLLRACERCDDADRALQVFGWMLRSDSFTQGLNPDALTFRYLLAVCGRAGKLRLAAGMQYPLVDATPVDTGSVQTDQVERSSLLAAIEHADEWIKHGRALTQDNHTYNTDEDIAHPLKVLLVLLPLLDPDVEAEEGQEYDLGPHHADAFGLRQTMGYSAPPRLELPGSPPHSPVSSLSPSAPKRPHSAVQHRGRAAIRTAAQGPLRQSADGVAPRDLRGLPGRSQVRLRMEPGAMASSESSFQRLSLSLNNSPRGQVSRKSPPKVRGASQWRRGRAQEVPRTTYRESLRIVVEELCQSSSSLGQDTRLLELLCHTSGAPATSVSKTDRSSTKPTDQKEDDGNPSPEDHAIPEQASHSSCGDEVRKSASGVQGGAAEKSGLHNGKLAKNLRVVQSQSGREGLQQKESQGHFTPRGTNPRSPMRCPPPKPRVPRPEHMEAYIMEPKPRSCMVRTYVRTPAVIISR
ncbi:hypothetical protein CYMTET_43103 [Cymbomonas tetramitiformis]|uniref:Pentatricopeptide repeat-containing protein n=1 Tax=Cymbomonas tetramitiformis TaxID=36881 RepID=A0AAE0C4R0_9CHLO|nr:hypothetical protein CYMTET_43103 [Cymbomonas tetramitiformis]